MMVFGQTTWNRDQNIRSGEEELTEEPEPLARTARIPLHTRNIYFLSRARLKKEKGNVEK